MEHLEIKDGIIAPDFKLTGSDDRLHTLKDFEGRRIILYFYPKDSTQG
jgi:peroxiredoxin Q/BCP